MRVAAVQFEVGDDVEANLATCLRMIEQAAASSPDLIVLPEFCNHVSWYTDRAHAHRIALDVDGDFVRAIGAAAARHGVWLNINATLRRDNGRTTGTNILFTPGGQIDAMSDKRVLMGAERDFLDAGDEPGVVIETPLGRIGLYACMEGVMHEPPRCLALDGAQILVNSLNSFALDEASLHIPVRAAENKVWVVAANKVGPLIPADSIEAVASVIGVPSAMLHGAGESQVVAPDGTVVAKGPRVGEAVVVADIDVERADDKMRPDGTDIFTSRRPELYASIASEPSRAEPSPTLGTVTVAACASLADLDGARDAQLIVLPELTGDIETLRALAGDSLIATSVREGDAHVGVLVGSAGVLLRQKQLHACARHGWATDLGEAIEVLETQIGRIALVVGGDAVIPESVRLAALARAEIVCVSGHVEEPWEVALGLLERAAENRVNLIAASRSTDAGACVIASLPPDLTLWAPERERAFAGTINMPDVVRGTGTIRATVHPSRAANRFVSKGTNLVDGRPWRALGAIVRA